MSTKLTGYGVIPHRPRRTHTKGMFTTIELDVANAVKKLAVMMDVSCASVINAILRKSLKLDELSKWERTPTAKAFSKL